MRIVSTALKSFGSICMPHCWATFQHASRECDHSPLCLQYACMCCRNISR